VVLEVFSSLNDFYDSVLLYSSLRRGSIEGFWALLLEWQDGNGTKL